MDTCVPSTSPHPAVWARHSCCTMWCMHLAVLDTHSPLGPRAWLDVPAMDVPTMNRRVARTDIVGLVSSCTRVYDVCHKRWHVHMWRTVLRWMSYPSPQNGNMQQGSQQTCSTPPVHTPIPCSTHSTHLPHAHPSPAHTWMTASPAPLMTVVAAEKSGAAHRPRSAPRPVTSRLMAANTAKNTSASISTLPSIGRLSTIVITSALSLGT
eukprot:365083-Chlamydomonas_euryale.AAC.38